MDIITEQLLETVVNAAYSNKLIVTSSDPVPQQAFLGVQSSRADMITTHEEADMIIPQQVATAVRDGRESIKVICDDVDVFVLLVYFYNQEECKTEIYLAPTSSSSSLICIKSFVAKHSEIIPSLPAAHGMSGCDSVPMVYGIGKTKVCSVLRDVSLLQLGDVTADETIMIEEAKTFVARCYGIKNKTSMADVR